MMLNKDTIKNGTRLRPNGVWYYYASHYVESGLHLTYDSLELSGLDEEEYRKRNYKVLRNRIWESMYKDVETEVKVLKSMIYSQHDLAQQRKQVDKILEMLRYEEVGD